MALDLPVSRITDDSQLRHKIKDDWFIDTPASVLSRGTVAEQLPTGEAVNIHAVEGREEIMVIIARELMRGRIETDTAPAEPRRPTGQFPGWAQGSWMLTRRKDTGAGVRIRIFLRSDQYTYIDLWPLGNDKSQMDVILYGGIMVRALPIAVPFERLYTIQLNEILRLAGDKFPRMYFEPEPSMYRGSRRLISEIRGRIRELRYADDGAINENGDFVFIETLEEQTADNPGVNCSGFAKWLIDGILRPITEERLPIEPLKAPYGERGSSFTEIWEDKTNENRRDPYFGLDWIRNLAAEANEVIRSSSIRRSLEEFEVRSDNFSQVLVSENRNFVIRNYPGFLPEAGYGFEGLHPLLYTLAIENPFSFYLAAINNEHGAAMTAGNPRGAPRLRQYFHIAALFPYFDEHGNFRIVVFESATESSFAGFRGRYPGHYINLVEIPVSDRFDP